MFRLSGRSGVPRHFISQGLVGVALAALLLGSSGVGVGSAVNAAGVDEENTSISTISETDTTAQEETTESASAESSNAEPSESESSNAEPSESESSSAEPSEGESPSAEPSESESPSAEPSEGESPSAEPSESESTTDPMEEIVEPDESMSAEPSSSPSSSADKNAGSVSTDKSVYLPGETVIVTGAGWNKEKKVAITVTADGFPEPVSSATVDVGKKGEVEYSLLLPKEFIPLLTVTVTGEKFGESAQTTIQEALIDVSIASDRPEYEPLETVALKGSGWKTDTSVTIAIEEMSQKIWKRFVKVPVELDGLIADSFVLPEFPGARYSVTATGDESQLVAETSFIEAAVIADATITVRKAGVRTSTSTESGLAGATFVAYNVESSSGTDIPVGAPVSEPCVTDVSGICVLNVDITGSSDNSDRFVVVETSAPGGWTLLQQLRTGFFSSTPGTVTDYRFNVSVSKGSNETVPDSERHWANAKVNPPWPGVCGLNIALLFDQSGSIDDSEWAQMKQAATGFVDALSGTPSRISVFTFASSAPANATFPLASVKAPAEADALKAAINAIPKGSGSTNWDAGLYQIATSGQAINAVLVLTDGDPTVYAGGGDGSTVTIQNVEEAVHSSNAIKSMPGNPRVVGVGIGMAANSFLNLAAISGPANGSDYFTTNFAGLGDLLKEIALAQCAGTVTVEKQIGSTIPGAVDDRSNGWPFSSSITAGGGTAIPSSGVTAERNGFDGLLQFEFDGGSWPKTVTIAETGSPAGTSGFTLADIQCTVGGTPIGSKDLANGSVTLQLGIDDSVRCVFLNERDTGSLKIEKNFTPGSSGYNQPFSIDYECLLTGSSPISGTVSVAPNSFATVEGIPSGYVCTVSEDLPGDVPGYTWSDPSITGSPTTPIVVGATVTVTVVNTLTRDTGSLELAKSLTGGPAGFDGPFELVYDCGDGFAGSRDVLAGSAVSVSGIPTGSVCQVSEPVLPTAPVGYSFGDVTFNPTNGQVTITEKGATVTVTVVNTLTRDTGSLTITKTFNSGGSGFSGDFTMDYTCSIEDLVQVSGSVVVAAGATATITGIPTGSVCSVTEAALPPVAGFVWAAPIITGSPTAEIDVETVREVDVVNTLTAIPIPPPPGPPQPVSTVITAPQPGEDPPPVAITDPQPGEDPPPVAITDPQPGEEIFPVAVAAGSQDGLLTRTLGMLFGGVLVAILAILAIAGIVAATASRSTRSRYAK